MTSVPVLTGAEPPSQLPREWSVRSRFHRSAGCCLCVACARQDGQPGKTSTRTGPRTRPGAWRGWLGGNRPLRFRLCESTLSVRDLLSRVEVKSSEDFRDGSSKANVTFRFRDTTRSVRGEVRNLGHPEVIEKFHDTTEQYFDLNARKGIIAAVGELDGSRDIWGLCSLLTELYETYKRPTGSSSRDRLPDDRSCD